MKKVRIGGERTKLLFIFSIIILAIPILSIDLPHINRFKWNASTGVMISYDGLKYKANDQGYITVRDYNNEWLEHFGFGITTKIGPNNYKLTNLNFSWSWDKEDIIENSSFAGYLFTGQNDHPTLNWTIYFRFYNDSRNMKVTHKITNNLGAPMTNTKFWYLNTIDETKNATFDGNTYPLSNDYHETENLNSKYPEIDFYHDFLFNYNDLIKDNFNITDIIVNNDSIVGLEGNNRMLAIGITKGNGVLPNGATVMIDPEINVYQDEKLIKYNFAEGHINVSLYVEGEILDDLIVYTKEDGYKFAANNTAMNDTEKKRFDAKVTSTHEMELFIPANRMDNGTINFTYPEFCVIIPAGETSVDRHCHSFEDVCRFNYSNCEYSLSADKKTGWVNATSLKWYDPEITSYPNSTGSAAWWSDVEFNRPPNILEFTTESSYSASELDDISADDSNYVLTSVISYPGHRVRFYTNINPDNINTLNLSMKAACYSMVDECAMYVWNYTSGSWVYLMNHTNGVETMLSYEFDSNTNFSDIINNSHIYGLIMGEDVGEFSNDAEMYYAFIKVNYSQIPAAFAISPADRFENLSDGLVEINFTCNATDEESELANISLYLSDVTGDTRVLNQSTSVSGLDNQSSWLVNLSSGEYTWICRAYNNKSNYADSSVRDLFIGKDVYHCNKRTFNTPDIAYTIKQNITYANAEPCIEILANNITFDFEGHAIDGDNQHLGNAINIDGFNDTTIYNGTIYDFLYNIRLIDSYRNVFEDLILGYALVNYVEVNNGSNNLFNRVYSDPEESCGVIYFELVNSNNNNVTNFNITCPSETTVLLTNSSNNYFIDGYIESSPSGGEYDLDITSNSINNILINVTFNNSDVNIDASSNFTKKWWYKAYVNDTTGAAISGATITATNVLSSQEFSTTTDGTGWIEKQTLTDYVNNGGSITYYSLHTLEASKPQYKSDSHTLNVTLVENKMDDYFTLGVLVYTNYIIMKDFSKINIKDGSDIQLHRII